MLSGPRSLIGAMVKIQSHDASHTASFAMKGAVAALRIERSVLESMRESTASAAIGWWRDSPDPGSALRASAGAYVFPNMRGLMERFSLATSSDLARAMLLSLGIAAVPGSAFGTDGTSVSPTPWRWIESRKGCSGSSNVGAQAPGRGLMTRERPKRGRSSLVSCIAVLAGVLLSSHRPASGATGPVAPQVVVLELFGHSAHHRRVRRGGPEDRRAAGASLVILELDTQEDWSSTQVIVRAITHSPVPVVVYVAGAHAASAGFYITLSADVAVMAPEPASERPAVGLGARDGREEESS